MPREVKLAIIYNGLYTCRICSERSEKGRVEYPTKIEKKKGKKVTFVCEECLIKNKEGKLSLK